MKTTHNFDYRDICSCGATYAQVLDNLVSTSCPNAADPKLVERVARTMCRADGNDPDALGYKHHEYIYSGLASQFKQPVSSECAQPLWHVYAPLAAEAVIEINAYWSEEVASAPASIGWPFLQQATLRRYYTLQTHGAFIAHLPLDAKP